MIAFILFWIAGPSIMLASLISPGTPIKPFCHNRRGLNYGWTVIVPGEVIAPGEEIAPGQEVQGGNSSVSGPNYLVTTERK
jgi:hypothetical protein